MFSDPLTAAMTMQILCFFGMVVIFIFVMRSLSSLTEELRESFRKQQMFLSDMERQLMDLNFAVRRLQGEDADSQPVAQAARSDDLLSLLENAARNASSLPLDGSNPRTSPAASLGVEDYDPAKDPDLFEDAYSPAGSLRSFAKAGRDRRS